MRRVGTRCVGVVGTVAALAAALALGGCAERNVEGYVDNAALAQVLRQRGLDPSAIVLPYGITDEMREWVDLIGDAPGSSVEKLNHLQMKLLDPKEIEVKYQWGYTGTAVEVFENHKANCLAFTNLFVGLARELGIEVYFMIVEDSEKYRRTGDLVVISDHIVVGYGSPVDRVIYDFGEREEGNDYRHIQKISDLTAIAMFHSNRGAEALQQESTDVALDWLRRAVAIEPNLANAWINLGVALRRVGDSHGAEEAYKRALEIDPTVYSAYHNLASLLRSLHRDDEARGYEIALEHAPSRNPYTYLSLGDISLLGGRVNEAEKFYRRAINLSEEAAEPYAALGQLAVNSGDLRLARRMLKKAQKIEEDNPRAVRLEAMIARHNG